MTIVLDNIILGALISALIIISFESIKLYIDKRKSKIYELSFFTNILNEIDRAIDRSHYMFYLKLKDQPEVSYSNIYTKCFDTSITEIIKNSAKNEDINRLFIIHSIFHNANLNINLYFSNNKAEYAKKYYFDGVSFLENHMLEIIDNYNILIKNIAQPNYCERIKYILLLIWIKKYTQTLNIINKSDIRDFKKMIDELKDFDNKSLKNCVLTIPNDNGVKDPSKIPPSDNDRESSEKS